MTCVVVFDFKADSFTTAGANTEGSVVVAGFIPFFSFGGLLVTELLLDGWRGSLIGAVLDASSGSGVVALERAAAAAATVASPLTLGVVVMTVVNVELLLAVVSSALAEVGCGGDCCSKG